MKPNQGASLRELVGLGMGAFLAPLAARMSSARRARMFHPEGRAFRARVEVAAGLAGHWAKLAAQLEGPALARFSGALWRGNFEHWDVLGLALRLRADETLSSERAATDQDLLFATIRSPFTLPLAPFTTNAHDYLANTYWAVSPFDVGAARHVKFRLSSQERPARSSRAPRGQRNQALVDAVTRAPVPLRFEARQTFDPVWQTIATVRLLGPLDIDQEALRFSPFQTGRAIVPSGFVHALRRATYAASQAARPGHAP